MDVCLRVLKKHNRTEYLHGTDLENYDVEKHKHYCDNDKENYFYNRDGKFVCSNEVEGFCCDDPDCYENDFNRLIFYNDSLFVGCSNLIFKLDTYGNVKKELHGHKCGYISDLIVYQNSLYSGCSDGSIRTWNKYGKLLGVLKDTKVISSKFAIHDNKIYSVGFKGFLYEWEENLEVDKLFKIDKEEFHCIAFFNKLIYIGCESGMMYVFDLQRGFHWTLQKKHFYTINCLCVYDNLLYSGDEIGEIHVWNHYGLYVRSLKGHKDEIKSLVVYNDLLYSGCEDSTIRTWNKQGQCIQILDRHGGCSFADLISHNNLLYSASLNKIFVWGEYYPHLYYNLPYRQKEKIKNWRFSWNMCFIQKDLAFLIERELLR